MELFSFSESFEKLRKNFKILKPKELFLCEHAGGHKFRM